ncbi:uncharacterized protein LY89DRAFT_611477 [Mollisia scopiformis]|uniref:DUF4238 domain-containing protein n=1 Tax=Mollisia scopiformis TaxID=149040 RepID=A0A194XHV6_MOLSC|nr:uncharacterized protein LY89DRAFT_611477 [Mollisia scopiformis]KUJ19709.1 hypothetical protein LY89DRAFT_611477 [Mollisia scopiformis]
MADIIRTQYQHFVPQFLLRNFSHVHKPRKGDREKKKHPKGKGEKRIYPGDRVVNTLDLSEDPPVLCEARVNRIFGQMDMYRDTSKDSPEQQHVEEMFSKLEGQASIVFRKITKAFEQKEPGLWLTREEKDLVRKFLFLLQYRGSGYHQRFYRDRTEDYDANDRELLWEYMAEKGFKQPMDVWLHNLRTIMELRMDPEKKWIHDLPKCMYTDDAMGFIIHAEGMYMAICTPSNAGDEFILTDNSYNVFEGPNCFVTDKSTGKVEGSAHAPLHHFAPISAKLMIILRSFVLPVPEEDANPRVKEERDELHFMALGAVYNQEVKSVLSDLPIAKARNNYSKIVGGRLQLLEGEDGKHRKDHKFYFKYFPIHANHVQTINGIFLYNAYLCSRIVFGTKDNFSRTLEEYLTANCNIITGDDVERRLEFLKKLAAVSKVLGSDKEPLWKEEPNPEMEDYEGFRLGILEMRRQHSKMIKGDMKLDNDLEAVQMYRSLGGTEGTFFMDMDQARRMWILRVKIDVWSQGLDESLRQRNRLLLTESYCRLPSSRVWFYVKHIRAAVSGQLKELETNVDLGDGLQGPEDTIAKAAHIIKPQRLAQLIYQAATNDIALKESPEINLWAKIDKLDMDSFKQLKLLRRLNASELQHIRHCGIDEIEQVAREEETNVFKEGIRSREEAGNSILEEGERIELSTRMRVRSKFVKALRGKIELTLLKALKEVFFKIIFPTPV